MVPGNGTISLSSKYSNAKISSPPQIQVFSNSSNISASRLSSVFIADVQFLNSSTATVVLAASGAGSNPLTFIGDAIPVNVTALCAPGQFVDLGPHAVNSTSLHTYLSAANGSNLCMKCKSGTVSTQETPAQCFECSSGTFSNSQNTRCTPCSSNTWAPARTQDSCFSCESDYVASSSHDRCIYPCIP